MKQVEVEQDEEEHDELMNDDDPIRGEASAVSPLSLAAVAVVVECLYGARAAS